MHKSLGGKMDELKRIADRIIQSQSFAFDSFAQAQSEINLISQIENGDMIAYRFVSMKEICHVKNIGK